MNLSPLDKLIRSARMSARLLFFVIYLLGGMLLGLIHRLIDLLSRRHSSRLATANIYLQIFCRLIGFRLHVHGQLPRGTVLVASNHVSWVDIPVIGSLLPVHFLSKAEVRQWPLIGWLAQEAGTLFIKRGAGQSGSVVSRLGQTLEQGCSVLVFPEGTTGTGEHTLKFHGKMLRAAIDSATPIQPVSLCYVRDQQPDREIPFVGDDDFVQHILRLFKAPRIDAHVILHTPLLAPADADPTELAKSIQQQVEAGLQKLLAGLADAPEHAPAAEDIAEDLA